MNATIQEIEGIDDYWGPAFRSVYEGEGHEAFVQQLDERILQHDKEIEKLCNFHYQPEKRKRQGYSSKGPIEPVGVSHECTDGGPSTKAPDPQHGHCETSSDSHVTRAEKYCKISDNTTSSYDGNDNKVAKRRRLDPKHLGGYSNVFPDSSLGPNMSASAYKTHNLEASPTSNISDDESFCYDGYTDGTPELYDENGDDWVDWNAADLSCGEYKEISEYHSLAEQQKSQKLVAGNEPDDLRVYLRNRKRFPITSDKRYQVQNRDLSKPYQDEGQKSSAERSGRGHTGSTSTEPLRSNRRDVSDRSSSTYGQYYGSNRHTSSEKIDFYKRRSRRDKIDDRYNRESWSRYRSPSHHNSAERQYRERCQVSSNNSDRACTERHSDKTRNHYRESGHASASHQGKLSPDRHYDQRRHDTAERQYRDHYGPANQREYSFGQIRHDSTERQTGNRRYATATRILSDRTSKEHNIGRRRPDSAEFHNGEDCYRNSPNERDFYHRSSIESQNGDRRHEYVSLQGEKRSCNGRYFGQRPPGSADRGRDESRHASTSLQRKERTSNERQFGHRRYESAERKNNENCVTSVNHARLLGRKRYDSSDCQIGDRHQANSLQGDSKDQYFSQAEHQNGAGIYCEAQCGEHLGSSSSPLRIVYVEHQPSSNACEARGENESTPGPSNDLRSYLRSKTVEVEDNFGFNGSGSGSDPSALTMPSRHDRDCSNNRGIELVARNHIENCHVPTNDCNELDRIHPTQSNLMPTEHHVVLNCVEPVVLHRTQSSILSTELHENPCLLTELHQSQNGGLSATIQYNPNHAMSAETHPSQNRSLASELQQSQNRSLSAELHSGQNCSLLSSELQPNQSRSLSSVLHDSEIKHYYDDIGNTCTEFQQNFEKQQTTECGLAPSELKTNHRKPDAELNPINLTSSGERSIDLDATIEITAIDSPVKQSHGENLSDQRSQLFSYLKTESTFLREKCAAVPHSCGTSSEPLRCPSGPRGDNTKRITTESRSRQKEAARQCSTPDPEMKTEPNGNTFDEITDTSAIVSDNVSNDCHPDQNFVENQGLLSKNIVELVLNDNSLDPVPAILEMASADLLASKVVLAESSAQSNDSPKQIPLTVYSKRHLHQTPENKPKRIKRRKKRSKKPIKPAGVSRESTVCLLTTKATEHATKAESAAHNSLNNTISGQAIAQPDHTCNKLMTSVRQTSLKESQGFIDSIRELLDVRSHAEELHAEISNVDANVKETTEAICTKAEELIRARRVELNIAATIEKMELCLPLLTTYSKLKSQVEAKRYYPALKTLEQLEHVLLPRVGPYKWCATISADIPRLRQAIRDASMADLRDFLENIRKLSPQVGALALKQSQEMMGRNLATIVKNKKDKMLLSTSEIEAPPQCPHELVDFSPLHRCLHIHTVLGAKNDFIQYYRAQRKQQARLVLIPASTNLHDSIRGVKDYLNAVLGFFILEEHLLSAAAGLVSKDWLLDTWSMSVNKVASTLRTNTSLITDPTLMLSIKHQIVLFINTIKCYGLPVEPLPTLLQEMAEHYTEVLMQRWVVVFRDILDKAAFTPIEVHNEEEYDDVVNNFPYDASDLEMQPFPKSFPFSWIVPSVYVQVKEFLYAWLKYSAGLGLGGGRRAAAARHSASLLLTRSFTGCLSALFHTPLPLMQLVQIIVDTQYLEDATVCLYEFISNITGSGTVSTQPVAGLFQSARDEAEQQICDNLQKKVDEFLDLENYDWLLVEPTGQASSFVTDMISYLKGVMESLHQLPEQARVAAVRAATNRIAVRLRNLLLEPAVKQISSGALYQLDLDVMQCEQFAASEPVTGLREGELLEHFASLRQLLDLITGWDWSSYLHDVGIEGGKYALVTPRDAATLLEKFKEAEQKSSVFSVLKKNERDKRKLLDTVLKQLKQLQNQDGS